MFLVSGKKRKKRILLAVSGLTPQVVTETLYALAVMRKPSWVPDEVHLITTAEGKERACLQLLADPPGWFHRLIEDYRLPHSIRFDEQTIHLLCDSRGHPIEDIRTVQDNALAADAIVEVVRRLTSDSDSELHVSIAGGRKTMGFFLGYALSLYGRDQDVMSHVLVSEPYESLPDFFYPSPRQRIIYARDGRPVDASRAKVWLAEIPYVRMREGLPDALRYGRASYTQAVRAIAQRFVRPHLVLRVREKKVETPLGSLCLPPVDFAFYWWLAEMRRTEGNAHAGVVCPKDGVPEPDYAQQFLKYLKKLLPGEFAGHFHRTAHTLREGMTKEFFQERKTRINRALRTVLGVPNSPYEIARIRRNGRFYFGLLHLLPEAIEVT